MIRKPTHEALRKKIMAIEKQLSECRQSEKLLSENKQMLESVLDGVSALITYMDRDEKYRFVNRAYADWYGLSREEMIGKRVSEILSPDVYQRVSSNTKKALSGQSVAYENTVIDKNGTKRHVNVNYEPHYRDTEVKGFFVSIADITKRKDIEKKLSESEELYKRISSIISDVIYSCKTDADGIYSIDWMAGAAEQISGYTIEEIKEQKCWRFLVIEKDLPLFEERVIGLAPGTHASCELRIRCKNGETAWVASSVECIEKPENPGCSYLYGSLIDITERKREQELLLESERTYRELSITDSLTQLYNSRHFYTQITMEISRADRYGQPLTLLFLDIDDFKQFNDAYGHVKGDKVLSRLGQVIKRQLRQADSAYRYGGEEFIMILPMTTTANGVIIAERIISEFKKENFSTMPDEVIHTTVSIGIAQYRPGEDIKELINRVDQRMYQAKKAGKDRFCSESEAHEPLK